jgi:hypothetical protein
MIKLWKAGIEGRTGRAGGALGPSGKENKGDCFFFPFLLLFLLFQNSF